MNHEEQQNIQSCRYGACYPEVSALLRFIWCLSDLDITVFGGVGDVMQQLPLLLPVLISKPTASGHTAASLGDWWAARQQLSASFTARRPEVNRFSSETEMFCLMRNAFSADVYLIRVKLGPNETLLSLPFIMQHFATSEMGSNAKWHEFIASVYRFGVKMYLRSTHKQSHQ